MARETLQARSDATLSLAAAIAGEPEDGVGLGWWLSGGASLLVWTGIALLLTSA